MLMYVLKGMAFLAITPITYIICVGTKAGTGTPNASLVLEVARLASVAIFGLRTALVRILYEHRLWKRPPDGLDAK